ncbi:MAG: LLM class flavin-dependent oxidoreductase [Micromonosporaceae bacterium]|jgi:alkanesulfonate monooxygenase SsuD/methylene tetrahydromethanopterin reductase-like flavin-dependent oxidoreductase (luciferase family)
MTASRGSARGVTRQRTEADDPSGGGTGPAVGVILPSVATQRDERLDLATAARHAEEVGLDSVWHGDHLLGDEPTLDCTLALAVAAAATRRVRIGTSVLVPALRPLVWVAKQVATLQYLAQGRLVVGVGSGVGPAQWAAAGVPYPHRGRRTDTALALLPGLLAGDTVRLADEPGQPEVRLSPAVPRPPFWVGNASPVAIRRAARLGDGWFPSVLPVEEVAQGAARLADLAAEAGRPVPTIAVGAAGALGYGSEARDRIAAELTDAYGMPPERAAGIPLVGGPEEVAERLQAYREAGAAHVVVGFSAAGWRRQCDLLAEARSLLR